MINVEELTIHEMNNLMDKGIISSYDLTLLYLDRICKYDKNGISLNTILEINPDALHIAEAMDYERRNKGKRGLMHGIPIVIKDNISTGDKMHTSAGSIALSDLYAKGDAFLVKRLRETGAIILAKSNMTEFANFMGKNMPAGYSSRGGQVKNPYDVERSPSGSSSGSAVAVAANLCAVSVGTETNGSIISPSKINCVVGIKPTVGLISRDGIIPISNSQDTAGPIARTVTDAAILLGAMAGVDEKDPATWKSKWNVSNNYHDIINDNCVKGLKVGVSMTCCKEFSKEEQEILKEAIGVLSEKGVKITQKKQTIKGFTKKESKVCLHEFKVCFNNYLDKYGNNYKLHTLEDVIAFNKSKPEKTLKYGQKILELSQDTSGSLTDTRYITDLFRDLVTSRENGIDKAMNDLEVDALLYLEDTDVAATSGYPIITIPAGFSSDGKAYGLKFVGRPFSEHTLIRLAYTYEKATKRRIPPKLA